jgi:hypothetical protein
MKHQTYYPMIQNESKIQKAMMVLATFVVFAGIGVLMAW